MSLPTRRRAGCTSERNWPDSRPRDIECTRRKTEKKYAKKFAVLSQVTGANTMGRAMPWKRTYNAWARIDSKERYFIIVGAKQNATT